MYKKTTRCNKCKHYDTENHKCDAFCSFIKETCDDVYQHGRADTFDKIPDVAKIIADSVFNCATCKIFDSCDAKIEGTSCADNWQRFIESKLNINK